MAVPRERGRRASPRTPRHAFFGWKVAGREAQARKTDGRPRLADGGTCLAPASVEAARDARNGSGDTAGNNAPAGKQAKAARANTLRLAQ